MKKHYLKTLLCSLAALAVSMPAFAEIKTFVGDDDITYLIDTDAKTATLSQLPYNQNLTNYNLVVPDEVTYKGVGYPVVTIAKNACVPGEIYLKTAKIGANVTVIGEKAFFGCSNLTQVTLGAKVKEIGVHAFNGCTSLGNVTFPASLESIGDFAFYKCTAIKKVDLPAGIKGIGNNPWGVCLYLEAFSIDAAAPNYSVVNGVLFDKAVTKLISYPIGCGERTYTTPATTKIIGPNSMRNNGAMQYITFNEGLEEIQSGAFNVCRLRSITLPASLVKLDRGVFTSNPALTEIKVASGNKFFAVFDNYLCTKSGKTLLMGRDPDEVTIPEEVDTIGYGAFYGMKAIKKLNLNKTRVVEGTAFYDLQLLNDLNLGTELDSIGSMAFMSCTSIKSLSFPATFRSIGDKQAFVYCNQLTSVTFNEGIQEIGDQAFMLCQGLTEIKIPGTIKHVGTAAFAQCINLRTLEVADGALELGDMAFSYNNNLTTVKLGTGLKKLGISCFANCVGIKKIDLPSTIEEIGTAAFQSVPLKEIVLPENLVTLGDNSFGRCGLQSVTFNSKLKRIGAWAFGTNDLQEVVLNEGVEFIGDGAFATNQRLLKLDLPSTVKEMGQFVAQNCPGISNVICHAVVPPVLTYDLINEDRYNLCKLTVPKESVSAYQSANFWRNFTHILGEDMGGIDDVVTSGDLEIVEIYDINGIRHNELQPGLNIVRYSDGSVRKIAVK